MEEKKKEETRKSEVQARKDKSIALLTVYKENLQKNQKFLNTIKKDGSNNTISFENTDLTILESTASYKYENLNNLVLNKKIR